MTELRRLTPDDWRLFRAVRLAALAEAPYAYGSTLADWQGENDAEPRWRQRLTDVPFNAVAYLGNDPAGVVGATGPNADGAIELISMWVAPFARGQGVADALIRAVVEYARTNGTQAVYLHVRENNSNAIAAYARNGFDYDGVAVDESSSVEWRMRFRLAD